MHGLAPVFSKLYGDDWLNWYSLILMKSFKGYFFFENLEIRNTWIKTSNYTKEIIMSELFDCYN